MVTNRLYACGLLSLLTLCVTPTRMVANDATATQTATAVTQLVSPRAKFAIVISLATIALLLNSEKSRTIVTKGMLNSVLASLRLLAKLPLPAIIKKSLQAKIEHLETIYTTRAGNEYTSDDLKAAFKDFKEMIDAVKAIEWVAVCAGILATTTK